MTLGTRKGLEGSEPGRESLSGGRQTPMAAVCFFWHGRCNVGSAMAESSAESHIEAVAHEILVYLAERPDAQDTLEGITEWWVLEKCIQRRVNEVRVALQELVVDGLVMVHERRGSGVLYRINRKRLQEIKRLVKEHSDT